MLLEKNAAFWQQVREDPDWAPMVRRIKEIYEKNYEAGHPALPYSLRHIYYENGSRAEFEAPYFKRRHMLSSAAVLSLIYPEETHYIKEVIDAMFAILDEYCWALPAHTGDDFEENDAFIDLFSAETGFILAEISTVLGDRLPKLVHERIRREFHRRITRGMEKRTYWWETDCTNNWAAVCAGSVGMAFMYLEPESFALYRPRLMHAMDQFLKGYPEDGTCLEGVGYWHYGFGYFWAFADLLKRYTDGKENLFDLPKVKNIACFMQNTFLTGSCTTSYADGSRTAVHIVDYGMQHSLYALYPENVTLLPEEVSDLTTCNTGWMFEYRNFMFFDPALQKTAKAPVLQDSCLPDAGQIILHRKGYSLAAKAGNNDEPHNHNDIGNFILSTKDSQIVADLGGGLYTKDYFREETRYLRFCNNSFSHNVPIINGQGQKPGAMYRGSMTFTGENSFEINFSEAYGLPELKELVRSMTATDGDVKITDRFKGEITEFTERFITLDAPCLIGKDGELLPGNMEFSAEKLAGVKLKGVNLTFNEAVTKVKIHTEEHLCHRPGESETVYCIDLLVDPKAGKVKVALKLD